MLRSILIIAVLFLLPACAEVELVSHVAKQVPIAEAKKGPGYFKTGSSYRIKGQRYTPRETYSFTQTGVASWYGPNFHGKKTANGEIFDKYELTAAHKTLQMPSIIRVTNLENGRSIIVRVNDRGPFSKGRILDLSERSAELLDFKHKGTAKIKIQLLPEESRAVANLAKDGYATRGYEVALNQKGYQPAHAPIQTAPKPPNRPVQLTKTYNPTNQPSVRPIAKPDAIFVQAGSFTNVVKARALAQKIQDIGPTRVNPTIINGSKHYRVQIGPLASKFKADQVVLQLASSNIGEPFLIRE